MVVSATERKPGPRILWRSSTLEKWMNRSCTKATTTVRWIHRPGISILGQKRGISRVFPSHSSNRVTSNGVVILQKVFRRILSICVRPKIVLIILIVRSTLTFLFLLGNGRRKNESFFFLHGCLRIIMLKSISVNVKIDRRQKTQIILFKYSS